MLVRTLSLSAGLALLILCCACSSRVFQPAQEIIHVDRSSSAATVNTTLRVKVYLAVEAPPDPRVPDINGNLIYPDGESARLHGRWLKAGIREDARMADFIRFSGAYEYSWWTGGGGVSITLTGSPDLTRLALRWGKFFPDVVKDIALSSPSYSRTVAAPADPYAGRSTGYPYAGQYETDYNFRNGYYNQAGYCPSCNLLCANCTCASNCCGNQVSPKPTAPKAGIDGASGPFVRK